ncbi:MAG TPA: TIGR01777 family oxidoreductase [Acidimicrobiales bacterium]
MKVAVTGSSGFIGTALTAALGAAGHDVVRVVRGDGGGPGTARWDPKAGTIDAAALAGVDAAVHLAGAGIADHRWTDDYKRELVSSRLDGTSLLARTLARLDPRPAVLVSASGIDYYGDRGDDVIDETASKGTGFLSDLCARWEAAADPAREAGIRVAHTRSGIVLSPRGGALKKQLPLFKLGLGGRFGSGRQWQSWIALDDEVGAMLHLLTTDVAGPVNLTAPNPVTNADFTTTLGAVLHRPTLLPVPSFGPKLLVGSELADVLLYESKRVVPRVLQGSGYPFRYPTLHAALTGLLTAPA